MPGPPLDPILSLSYPILFYSIHPSFCPTLTVGTYEIPNANEHVSWSCVPEKDALISITQYLQSLWRVTFSFDLSVERRASSVETPAILDASFRHAALLPKLLFSPESQTSLRLPSLTRPHPRARGDTSPFPLVARDLQTGSLFVLCTFLITTKHCRASNPHPTSLRPL